jgi:hypothetical protein
MRCVISSALRYRVSDGAPCEGAVRVGNRWEIEIPDFPARVALSKRLGHALIVDASCGKDPPDITIYDDYLE